MALLTPPPKAEYTLLDPDVYEAVCTDVEEVPNNFYDPQKDPPSKSHQFEWKFTIVDDGPGNGATVTAWTSNALSRSEKSKLMPLINILDKEFDIEKGYPSLDEFRRRMIGKNLRIVVKNKEGKKKDDGTTPIYNRVESFMPSKRPALTEEALQAMVDQAFSSGSDDIPF